MSERPVHSGAVIGLGMIGRHHARLMQASDRVAFRGAVDPGGDRYRAVAEPDLVRGSVAELLAGGAPDFAIVAVPTDQHLPVARELMAAGVSVLVEKPLAGSAEQAREIGELATAHGVQGAVGHVERYNAPLRELRTRIAAGQLGEIVSISAVRSGPFAGRIRDVGVVMDLASHDIDVLGWISESSVARLCAEARHRSGETHEDLVIITGALRSGPAFNLVVDRISPTKQRRTRVLGERGLLEADTLTGDLFFYENAEVSVAWDASQQFRGVSEGNVTRYALQRAEPLAVELDAFLDALEGFPDAEVVTLARGMEIVMVAEAALRSARSGESVTVP